MNMENMSDKIIKTMQSMTGKYGIYNIFEDWVCMMAMAYANQIEYSQKRENEYIETMRRYDEAEKAKMYVAIMSIPTEEQLSGMVDQSMVGMDRATIEATLTQALTQQMGMAEEEVASYLADMSDEDLFASFRQMMEIALDAAVKLN